MAQFYIKDIKWKEDMTINSKKRQGNEKGKKKQEETNISAERLYHGKYNES